MGRGGLCVWVIWLSGWVCGGVESVCESSGWVSVCVVEGEAVGVDLCLGLWVGVIVCA